MSLRYEELILHDEVPAIGSGQRTYIMWTGKAGVRTFFYVPALIGFTLKEEVYAEVAKKHGMPTPKFEPATAIQKIKDNRRTFLRLGIAFDAKMTERVLALIEAEKTLCPL